MRRERRRTRHLAGNAKPIPAICQTLSVPLPPPVDPRPVQFSVLLFVNYLPELEDSHPPCYNQQLYRFVYHYKSLRSVAPSGDRLSKKTNTRNTGPPLYYPGGTLLFQNQGLQTVDLARQHEQTYRLGGGWSSCRCGSK